MSLSQRKTIGKADESQQQQKAAPHQNIMQVMCCNAHIDDIGPVSYTHLKVIAADPEVSKWLQVVFVENYNVTAAEKLIPVSYTHLKRSKSCLNSANYGTILSSGGWNLSLIHI